MASRQHRFLIACTCIACFAAGFCHASAASAVVTQPDGFVVPVDENRIHGQVSAKAGNMLLVRELGDLKRHAHGLGRSLANRRKSTLDNEPGDSF